MDAMQEELAALPPIRPGAAKRPQGKATYGLAVAAASPPPASAASGRVGPEQSLDSVEVSISCSVHQCTCPDMIRSSRTSAERQGRASRTSAEGQGEGLVCSKSRPLARARQSEPGGMVITPGYLLPLAREYLLEWDVPTDELSVVQQTRREALKLLTLWEELEEMLAQLKFWKEEGQRASRLTDQLRGIISAVITGQRAQRGTLTSAPTADGDPNGIDPPPAATDGDDSAACARARQHAAARRRRASLEAARQGLEKEQAGARSEMPTPRTRTVTWC